MREAEIANAERIEQRAQEMNGEFTGRWETLHSEVGTVTQRLRSNSSNSEAPSKQLESRDIGQRSALQISRSDEGWRSIRMERLEKTVKDCSEKIREL